MQSYTIFLLLFPLVGASKKTVNMSGPVADFIKSTINSDTVVIFSKTYCPYCRMAKEVFDEIKQKYTAVELDERDDSADMQDILCELTGARSVPRVFVKGKCVGGGTDVKALYQNGQLQQLLSAS